MNTHAPILGPDGREFTIAVATASHLKIVAETDLPTPALRAMGAKKYRNDSQNPDLLWVQFVMDTEGANANHDYMPRPQLLEGFHTARFKPFDMEHVIIESDSMVGIPDKKNPPVTNTIFGVMTHAVLSWADGTLLSEDEIEKLDNRDVMNRPDSEKVAVTVWAGLYRVLFPKTVGDLKEEIDDGNMHVSMERWIYHWDFLVANQSGKYEAVGRKAAVQNGIADKWAKFEKHNGMPIYRRTLDYVYGGCASTTRPANPNATYQTVTDQEKNEVAAAANSNELENLSEHIREVHTSSAISTDESVEDLIREIVIREIARREKVNGADRCSR